MTFIPLDHKNIIVNKVKNTIDVLYKNSDTSTHIKDKILDSKSLINVNNYENLSYEECNFDRLSGSIGKNIC